MLIPAHMKKQAVRDVARVRQHARAVITLGQDTAPSFITNNHSVLDVVAVVGPTTYDGVSVPEAVLCEVGLRRTRPYARSERRGNGSPIRPYLSLIQPRSSRFMLSAWQYRLAAPTMFSLLDGWMREIVGRWLWGPGAVISVRRTYVRRSGSVLETRRFLTMRPRGCRISVARKDHFLCADLLRIEMGDRYWREQLRGLAATVEMALKPLESGYREPFVIDRRVEEARALLRARLETMPNYIMGMLPRFLDWRRRRGGYRLLDQIAALIGDITGTRNGNPAWQERLAASALPGFQDRVGDIVVRDISSLRSDDHKPYLVFELLQEERRKLLRPRAKRGE